MKRRLSNTSNEFLKVRLTRAQLEKLDRIAKRISPSGTAPKAAMAIRHLIEEAKA